MRLYSTYYICRNLLETLMRVDFKRDLIYTQIYTIPNWKGYKEALMALRKIPLFTKEADDIYEMVPVFQREKEVPTIDDSIATKLKAKNENLYNRVTTIIELYESMNLQQTKHGIDVKIPECSELKEYINYLKELDFVFTQCPYLLSKDEKIEFDTVDVGSNWLSFVVIVSAGASVAFYILNNMAILLEKAIRLRSHYNNVKQQEESLKIAKKRTELAEAEVEIFQTLKKHYMKEMLDELKEEISPLNDGEEEGKVEKSLEKLIGLMDKGVEIYASLDTPKDVQVLFPAIDEANCLPENILKYIEDKNQTEE